ncbi:hypothetical protein HMPREF0208_04309 [Citrobacter koseri]|nr:hypothetical protein HMPREF3207_04221 [Citrobacter koseri]KXB40437.1 hypothetical protein HMPREF0208_04309 [Citrobacter koseri]
MTAEVPIGPTENRARRPDKHSAIGHGAGWRRKRLIRPTGSSYHPALIDD